MTEFITFTLAGERYAIDSGFTHEVFRLTMFSRLPSRNPLAFGVVVWRGDLLTILDIRSALGLPLNALSDLASVIVVGEARPEFGILADRVHHVTALDAPLEPVSGRNLVAGMTPDAMQVLEPEALLRLQA